MVTLHRYNLERAIILKYEPLPIIICNTAGKDEPSSGFLLSPDPALKIDLFFY
jgi:hypothetical protein